jgi:hypothetical protein
MGKVDFRYGELLGKETIRCAAFGLGEELVELRRGRCIFHE